MWVRSQDKTILVKVNYIRLSGNYIEVIHNDICTFIGKYSNEEKALKVLDMIEQFINCSEEYKAQGEYKREIVSGCNEINRLKTFVFQMPQDEDL